MNKATDWGAFCDMITAAAKVTRTRPPDNAGLTLFFDLLAGYSLEQVQAAMAAHLVGAEGKYFPTPAHIVQQLRGTEAERAELAWRRVVAAVSRWGCYESVRFPTPAYHFAIRELGGWERLVAMVNEMTDKELEFFGQKFAKLYSMGERCASWKAAPGREAVPPYFPGSFERENRTRGFLDHIPAPVDALTGRKLDRAALGSGAANTRTEHGGALVAAVATKKRVE